ncbi:MAG: hypothetical protein VB130_00720 [Clostridium sp.]|nr:hypothetical protein [Clostridium sp.]
MRVKAIWIVDLPLKFCIGNNFKKTQLTQFSFNIDEINFILLKNFSENIIEKVKIIMFENYDDNYLPSFKNIEYLSEFQDKISYKAGKAMQSFLDGFSKTTNSEYYQIFDGEDFTTPYTLDIIPNIMKGNSTNNGIDRLIYLDDDTLKKSINFACKEKNTLDIAWYFLKEAEHLIYIGKYELSLINMAIMIEFLVTSQLSSFLDNQGHFKNRNKHSKEIAQRYGERPTFCEKYFKYGLQLVTSEILSDNILNTIDFIYKVRDKLAHGKKLQDIKLLKEVLTNEYQMKDLFWQLLNDVIEVYNYFFDLNNK